jgi:hypothetical protein
MTVCLFAYVVLLVLCLVRILQSLDVTPHPPEIPRHIYTYWDSKDMRENAFIHECIRTWSTHNRGWTIHVINADNEHKYVSTKVRNGTYDSVQRYADFVRMDVLERNGGVWLDASIYMNESLDWIHSIQRRYRCSLIGYNNPIRPQNYVMENWFIACSPGCPFVREWSSEFHKSYHDTDAYIGSIPKTITKLVENPIYLTMNVCWKKVYETHAELRNACHLMDSKYGPFALQTKSVWNAERFKALFESDKDKWKPFIKLTKSNRKTLLDTHH